VLTTDQHRRLEVLDEAECRRLLPTAAIGRLAYTEGALPAILPVTFIVSDDRILIPTRRGSKVAAASRGAVVAFEVDDFDTAGRIGWNVTVVGPSRSITRPDEVAALDGLGARTWAPADSPCYVAVQIALIRGRRLTA
jgi:nitroimidazol reductase NimA-like FMN-containing flavoprotein (pyridoxamine 5'-phosphate oxidase superfamily)